MMTAPTPRATKRADAVRNVERILDAAIACLTERPTASMADIAKRAGLGRVTLYGHFASRAELLEAVVVRVLEQGERALGAVDLSGNPRDALSRLIESSWLLTSQAASIIAAAEERARVTVEDADRQAQDIVTSAHNEAEAIVGNAQTHATNAVAQAEDQADRALADAQAEADRLVSEGNTSYERSVNEGIAEQARLVDESEVVRRADEEAHRIVDSAHAESDRLRNEADTFVDGKLGEFEESLTGILRTVTSDRAALRRGAGVGQPAGSTGVAGAGYQPRERVERRPRTRRPRTENYED